MYKIRGADGKEYGPVTIEQLRQWVVEGRANSQTYVQGPESTEWKPLNAYPELAALLPPSAGTLPPAGAPGWTQPGQPMGGGVPAIPNYLWQSIAVTVCCCPAFGIPAIVFAAQVSSKLASGDIAGAMGASQKAKMWCWIAFGVGVLLSLLQLGYLGAMNFHLGR